MSGLIQITLGVMTAVGGFVDISELVFAAQAGSRFGYALIWVFALGTLVVIVFGEMSGRVAAVGKQAMFDIIRDRLDHKLGLLQLVLATIVSTLTCAAEIGGVAIAVRLLAGWPYQVLALSTTLILAGLGWLVPFKWVGH